MYHDETLVINTVLNTENIFMENHAENVHQTLVPDPFFNFCKQPKRAIACKKFFKK